MIRIRLKRQGSGKNLFFRVVACDKRNKVSGKALETLGFWHPSKQIVKISKESLESWIQKGAVLTDAVKKLLQK
jgi:small subunit ribosomal protein S16